MSPFFLAYFSIRKYNRRKHIREVPHIIKFIYNHKLLSIISAALLTVAVLTALVGLTEDTQKSITITEQNGIYDLTDISNPEKMLIKLLSGETYYPRTYLTPESSGSAIPESTEDFDEKRVEYLSQRFVVKVPDNEEYAVTLNLRGRHAMKVYVNGELAGQAGRLGTTKQDNDVWEDGLTFHAAPRDGSLDIIVQAARFYHFRGGARLASLTMEKAADTVLPVTTKPITGFVLVGAFLCAAVLLLGVYLMLSHTKATLFFALACLTMALREWIQSRAWTYFPVSGNLISMLEYMSVVLLTIFLSLYLVQYAVGRLLKITFIAAIGGSLIYGMILLFADSLFYTKTLVIYQLVLIGVIVPGVGGLFWTIRNPNREQSAVLYGISVFYIAAVADILMSSHLFGSGDYTTVSEAAMLVFVVAQTVSLFQMNSRVLTEAKEAEQKLEAEKTVLESLNRLKTEFLGNVSHELKTPLTVMSGYAQTTKQLAQNSNVPECGEVSRRMTLISSEAERLSLMVGQILDITRMEEGRMVMEPMRCYVDEIIHTAVETHYPILNKNRNRLDILKESGLPAVYADPARISQVVVNLISNAVRFTADGVITISAKNENDKILVSVSDTGTGIAEEQLPHVFERYNKKQKSGGQDTGTGLGLYICKHIVEQHCGEIRIESEKGRGTSAFFTLPACETNTVSC